MRILIAALLVGAMSQAIHEAPAGAPATGQLAPRGEPGQSRCT